MIVVARVFLADGSASRRCETAQLDELSHHPRVGLGDAREHPRGGMTDVGTVQARPDTLAQRLRLCFLEAGDRAGVAGRRAIEYAFDGFVQQRTVQALRGVANQA